MFYNTEYQPTLVVTCKYDNISELGNTEYQNMQATVLGRAQGSAQISIILQVNYGQTMRQKLQT